MWNNLPDKKEIKCIHRTDLLGECYKCGEQIFTFDNKRELSKCCAAEKEYCCWRCEFMDKKRCSSCHKPFAIGNQESKDNFPEKTLAELDKVLTDALVKAKIPVYEGYVLDIVGDAMESFLRSALNTQREEMINKIKFDETIPVMERKRFIDLISPNNKEYVGNGGVGLEGSGNGSNK